MTLVKQRISVIAAKQTVINEVNVFSIKYHFCDILSKKHTVMNFIYSIDKTFQVIKIMDFRLSPHATVLFFHTPVPVNKMLLFHT